MGPSPPRITVVTPSFNQARFIGQTLRSVLEQGYPDLEYFVVDGGSSDGSVDIIRAHADRLAGWVSEPDRGQSHAINKGLARATGEILCWLNSDDCLEPGALQTAAQILAPGSGRQALVGHALLVDDRTGERRFVRGEYRGRLQLLSPKFEYALHQPSIFWRRELTEKIGLLDESLHLIMDFDYWWRMAQHCDFHNVDRVLSSIHRHAATKTGDDHREYHAQRLAYIDRQRRRLSRTERLKLALLEGRQGAYAGIKEFERGMRRWFRRRR